MNISQVAERPWCPRIAVDLTGILYVVWEEGEAPMDRKIVIARSTDQGTSFGPPAILSPWGADSFCPSLAAVGGGRVYVTWSTGEYFAQTFQTFLSVSSDGGLTFSAPREVSVIDGSAACPEIELSEPNRLNLIWHDVPSGDTWPDIFHSVGVVSLP